jgi:pyruvate dehydrogenase E1 component
MIPFFIYYSMFGFQRIGDLIWAAGDMRTRGFLLGGTAGRTTLAGEGLQHQDGHTHLFASAFPTVRAYDPAFAYEVTVIVLDGMRRMYQEQEDCMYYITLGNGNYVMPPMLQGVEEGIVRGIYKYSMVDVGTQQPKVQLFGSGSILNEAIQAQHILAEKYSISSNVWSVTSYKELRRDQLAAQRWNMLHPTETPRRGYFEQTIEGEEGPFIAASDYVRLVAEQINPWVPGGLFALGTEGFGRSERRGPLRRFFEVDAQCIAVAALYRLSQLGKFDPAQVAAAIRDLGIDPEKIDPAGA